MVLHNEEGKIVKFSNVNDIIKYHFDHRIIFYKKRKAYLLNILQRDISLLEYKIKFISEFIDEKINIIKKRRLKL